MSKKVIVFIKNYAGYDDSVAVLAEEHNNGFIKVPGHQLHVIADEENRRFINKEAEYHVYKTDFKRKCYDCFQFNRKGKAYEPSVDTSYILRCQDYKETTGSPGFTVEEAIAAGVPTWKAKSYADSKTGLLYIRPNILRAC